MLKRRALSHRQISRLKIAIVPRPIGLGPQPIGLGTHGNR
jgi:hypothetical protein